MSGAFQPSAVPLLYGDTVADLCNWLRPLLPGVTVGSNLQGWTRPYPHLQLIRLGGLRDGISDNPEIEFQARGPTQDGAYSLAEKALALVFTAALSIPRLGNVEQTQGLYWLSDIDGDPRYMFRCAMRRAPL